MEFKLQNKNQLYSEIILSELVKNNITNFIVSPGLRNAPLLQALKKLLNDGHRISIRSCVDERAAGYMALGSFKATGKPSVLICTSGTALANYYPALLEANYSNIPIIIFSADRPYELHVEGANQTMNQLNFFQVLENETLHIPIEDDANDLSTFMEQVRQYFLQATRKCKSIHFNFPFKEPLDLTPEDIPKNLLNQFNDLKGEVRDFNNEDIYSPIKIEHCHFQGDRNIVVIGELKDILSKEDKNLFIEFLNKCPWPKIIDVTTSLKYQFTVEENCFPTFDHPEVYQAFKNNPPEKIIHFGGKMTSKKYHSFIKELNIPMIHIDKYDKKKRPLRNVQKTYHISPKEFIRDFKFNEIPMENTRNTESWISKIRKEILPVMEKKISIIDGSELSFPKISKFLISILPERSHLYLSNSTAIRSFDSFTSFINKKEINVLSHRGVSGIEGFIAASYSYHLNKSAPDPTVLVIGDISFLHDLNSLNLLKDLHGPMIILLINNNGGGIFSLVPFNDEMEIMPWMSTPHEINFSKVIEGFGVNYKQVDDIDGLSLEITSSLNDTCPKIIEVLIDNDKNVEIYQQLKTLRL